MQPEELTAALRDVGITQAELARLVGVTGRAVNMWVKNDRRIPGSVEAYLRLMSRLPRHLVALELDRLRRRKVA